MLIVAMALNICCSLCRRVTVHLNTCGPPSAADPPAGAEGPGHVRSHPHQHAVSHHKGRKWHSGEQPSLISKQLLLKLTVLAM